MRCAYSAQAGLWADRQAKPFGVECSTLSILKPKDDFYATNAAFSYLIDAFVI
jgi:hypothetical protein